MNGSGCNSNTSVHKLLYDPTGWMYAVEDGSGNLVRAELFQGAGERVVYDSNPSNPGVH